MLKYLVEQTLEFLLGTYCRELNKFPDSIVKIIRKGGYLKGQLEGSGRRLFWPADFDHSEIMTHLNGQVVTLYYITRKI